MAMANDDVVRLPGLVAALVVGSVLATLAVVVRIYSRHIVLRRFGTDDAVMVGAWIFLVATAVAIGLEYYFGLGKHVTSVSKEEYVHFMKAFLVSTIVYSVSMYLVKTSILLLYCRIFKDTRVYRFYFVLMLALAFWTVLLTFLLTFTCVPISLFWDPDAPGSCLNTSALWLSVAIINMVTDLACFIVPIPPLLKLRMQKGQKISLTGIFALALCPCAISAYRIKLLLDFESSKDLTSDNALTAMWSFIELSIGMISACMPTFGPVLVKFMPSRKILLSQTASTRAREPHDRQDGVSLRLKNTQALRPADSKGDSESTRELGWSDHDEDVWDRDEVSLNQLT